MARNRSTAAPSSPVPPLEADAAAEYTVVARRYRPQQFAELIGQEHVSSALINALRTGRVAHAYLFTGARGVGKTSAARILAKALNCVAGPTATPCDACDSCIGIAAGDDVDVLEIDGASNNKVEEIRDLRQNVGFRPTRSRYKIYIIDEVHMLSTQSFNALLKTLEEPPGHVKFIFATTEVQKIPITILSRCQRFNFASVGPSKIFDQLKSISAREGLEADEDALRLIARRAGGSMRDSQSLLDQLFASSQGRLTVQHVHATLGTTDDERVLELSSAILAHDARCALNLIATWAEEGLQAGELIDQLIEHWRNLMLVSCSPELKELPVTSTIREALFQQVGQISLDTILAGLEIWTTTKARMRGSSHIQVLLEMAVVRLSRLEDMLSLGDVLLAFRSGTIGAASIGSSALASGNSRPIRTLTAAKVVDDTASKKNGLSPVPKREEATQNGASGQTTRGLVPFTEESLPTMWPELLRILSDKSPILANQLKTAHSPAIFGPNTLAIRFDSDYNHEYETCSTESNVRRIQDALRKLTGQPTASVRVDLVGVKAASGTEKQTAAPAYQTADRRKRLMELPLFKKAADTLGAQISKMDDEFDPTAAMPKPVAAAEPEEDPEEI